MRAPIAPAVLKPLTTPKEPEIKLARTTLEKHPAWSWMVRSDDGRLVGFGICYNRADAVERAMDNFPRAILPTDR